MKSIPLLTGVCVLLLTFAALWFWSARFAPAVKPQPKPVASPSPPTVTEPTSPAFEQSATASGNLFLNPDFESGITPWYSMDDWGTGFTLSQAFAHSGKNSALLRLDSSKTEFREVEVHGVVQEVSPKQFPEKISGYYFVEDWLPGTKNQYLQFVVIVFGAKNIPQDAAFAKNHQIRFLLAGISEPPFEITNAKFVFHGKGQPKRGQWVYFERNIKEDFLREWGSVPEDFEKLRIFFEARWDGRAPTDSLSTAKVYYDDLSIGPARN